MPECRFVVNNESAHDIEINLSPWRGSVVRLAPSHRAALEMGLPKQAWLEVEVTELAVYVHGWPGTSCNLDVLPPADRLGVPEHFHWSSPPHEGSLTRVRSPILRAWASDKTDQQLRALVTESRVTAQEISITDPSEPGRMRPVGSRRVLILQPPAVSPEHVTTLTVAPTELRISGQHVQYEAVGPDFG